jgi:DegV family protein with EDD domain
MDKKVKIISDSTSDLSPELYAKYDIAVIPLPVTLGTDSYLDRVSVTPEDLYNYYNTTKKLPKTAAPAAFTYREEMEKWTSQGYAVICFTIGSGFSVSNTNARMAAEDLEDVYVIDPKNLSTGIGLLILEAAELAAAGMPAKEIAAQVEEMVDKVEASFIINNLEFLWKGGRCSGVAALGANVLRLKPCIEVVDGKMSVGKKYRGNLSACLKSYVKDRLADRTDIDTSRLFITHSGMDQPELVPAVWEAVEQYQHFDEVHFTHANCTVCTHCGPNTLGILFLRK